MSITFAKGHGTGNDFVLLADDDGLLELTEERVRRLSNRHFGIGADGVIRVTKALHVAGAITTDLWFMDYRNADGSVAEMCGNGIRVFAEYLFSTGRVSGSRVEIETRAGILSVQKDPRGYRVEMGKAQPLPHSLQVATEVGQWSAVGVLMPNPHAVAHVSTVGDIGTLREAPHVAPADVFPEGVNVEFYESLASHHIKLRVFERGVGETLSCGTGVCAAAFAARQHSEESGNTAWRVDVDGGTLMVEQDDENSMTLIGPAVIVATGVIESHLWD